MLPLTSTSDKFQVVTTAAGKVDVYAGWADVDASKSVTVGRLLTPITTATTADVVPAPASGSSRSVKNLKISNNHATVTNTVTLQVTDGTNTIAIEQVSLPPGWRMGYEEGVGIRLFNATGSEVITNSGQPTGNANTADVVANAAATYLTGGSLPIGGRIQPGSFFKWRLRASKTAAGVATATIAVVTGTAGTTADTARVTHSSTAIQTAAVDTGQFEVDAVVRSVGASAAVIESSIRLDHALADAAGFGTFRYLSANSAAYTNGASDIIGLVCNPGASGVWTFQEVLVDAGNLIY